MAENEGMEEKDFARQEKVKEQFEKVIMQIINEMENDNAVITLEGTDININIKKEKEVYQISLLGKNIVTVDENKDISYNIEELENIKKTLESGNRPIARYEDLGLPDIEYLKELEKDREKEKEEVKNTDEEKEEKEEDEEKPDLDEEKDKDEEESDKKKQLTKKSNWVKLDLSAEVVKGKTLRDLLKCNDEEAYIAPGKDIYDYSIVGGSKETGYHLLDSIERTEGKAPNQKIISIENNGDMDVNEKQALIMFKCKGMNDEGFTISKLGNGIGQERIEYYRKAYNDLYMSCPVAQETADRGVNKPNPETKELMSKRYYSRTQLSEKMDMHGEIRNEVNSQNLPDNVNPAANGIQIEELDREVFRQKLIENIIIDVRGSENPTTYEGYEGMLRDKATIMANKILDEDKYYEQAKQEVFGDREQGGRTPDQGQKKRGE